MYGRKAQKDKSIFGLSLYHMILLTLLIFSVTITAIIITFRISEQNAMAQQQLSGISFQMDNITFSHHMASVNGIQMHYVVGGQGDPIVLLHGWPETWYAWHKVMPVLAKNYTVIIPDLPGLGDSSSSSKPSSTGYDGKSVAEDI